MTTGINATAISTVLVCYCILTPEVMTQVRYVSGVSLPEMVSVNGEDLALKRPGRPQGKGFPPRLSLPRDFAAIFAVRLAI